MELARVSQFLSSKFSTAIMKINYPEHKGKPNPYHGKYHFVGRIPGTCYDHDRQMSKAYDTEQLAIDAAIAGGATDIQGEDCKFVYRDGKPVTK